MIRSVAIVPHPPLLVPELVGAAAAEVEPLRSACERAVRRLGTGRWYAIGVDESGPVVVGPRACGTFAGYGVPVPVSLTAERETGRTEETEETERALPLPLLVAGWLRERAGARSVVGELVHPAADPAGCLARGKELAAELQGAWNATADGPKAGAAGPNAGGDSRDAGGDSRDAGGDGPAVSGDRSKAGDEDWGVLVLADGATTHDAPGAGRVDPRAVAFDEAVAAALLAADPDGLAGLDPELAAALGARGRAAWQVLAGLALGTAARWRGELLYHAAPYGVGYHVAYWERR